MDYTDLDELGWQQDASTQLRGDAEEAEDNAVSEELTIQARLWDSTTPAGSPTTSICPSQEIPASIEEPIVYEGGANTGIVEEARSSKRCQVSLLVVHDRTKEQKGKIKFHTGNTQEG